MRRELERRLRRLEAVRKAAGGIVYYVSDRLPDDPDADLVSLRPLPTREEWEARCCRDDYPRTQKPPAET